MRFKAPIPRAFFLALAFLVVLGPGASRAHAQENTYPEWTKGAQCFEKQDYACCAGEMQKIITQDPKVASVYFLLGLCQVELKQLDAADKSLQKVLELEPKFGRAYVQLARIAKTRGQNDKAVDWINQGLANMEAKDKALAFKIRGGAYLDLKKSAEAEKDLLDATKLAPNDDGLYLLLGRLYRAKNQNEKAFEVLSKAWSLKSAKEAGVPLLEASIKTNKYDAAAKVGQALVDKGIKDDKILLNLGQAYLALKQYDKSAAVLAQIPGSDRGKLANLSQAYVGARSWVEAEKILLQWQQVDIKNPLVYDLLGRVYGNEDRPKESLETYKKGKANTGDARFDALIKAAQQALDKAAPTVPSKNG